MSGHGPAQGGPGGRPLLTVEEARDQVLAAIPGPTPAETVPLHDALWRVAATTVTARTTLPPWDNSAMDGYALRAADVAGASDEHPIRLAVVGEAAAGRAATAAVAPGTAVRIATGAPVPAGADAVIPVEQTTPVDAAGGLGPRGRDATGPLPAAVLVHEAAPVGGSIREAGSDLMAGSVILEAGGVLTPAAIALVAGAGHGTVSVHRRPRIAVLATGDEVRAPGEPLGSAGIPDANGPGLCANVRAAGGEAIDLGIAPDQLPFVVERLQAGLAAGADALLVAGGVSVGPYDVVKGAFETIGHVDLWKVSVQPGKPFAFGLVRAAEGQAAPLLFGLPGNPVSGAVTFELFVRPAIRRLLGHRDLVRTLDRGVLREPVAKSAGRRAFLRVVVERDAAGSPIRDSNGRLGVALAGGQGSHVLTAMAAADALAIIPETSDRLPAGAEVNLWWLDQA
jgi:molybdopterin molybdotransferase